MQVASAQLFPLLEDEDSSAQQELDICWLEDLSLKRGAASMRNFWEKLLYRFMRKNRRNILDKMVRIVLGSNLAAVLISF